MPRPTLAQLDVDALAHNVSVARRLAPNSKLMAVIKANAYGHGAVTIARALHNKIDALAVARTKSTTSKVSCTHTHLRTGFLAICRIDNGSVAPKAFSHSLGRKLAHSARYVAALSASERPCPHLF